MESVVTTMNSYGTVLDTVLAPENLIKIGSTLLSILLIIVISKVALQFSYVLTDRFIAANTRLKGNEGRGKTISTLVKSIFRYTVYFIGGVMVLQKLGFPVTSLLTAAGIGGLAVGFGAQNLVRDVITGFFILFEEQYNVGDYVELAGKSGIVEEMGIRTTKLRDFGGQLHIIPNGNIIQVTNFMGPRMRVTFDVAVNYHTDVNNAIATLEKAFEKVTTANPGLFKEGPTVLGVNELNEASIGIRVWGLTEPMQQWSAARILKKAVKEELDAAGIESPAPNRRIIIQSEGESKE